MFATINISMENYKYLIIIIVVLLCSCKNYNNENYLQQESLAIDQLITEIIQYDKIDTKTDYQTLLLTNKLHTNIILGPSEEVIVLETNGDTILTESIIPNIYKEEKRAFKPFLKDKLKPRKIENLIKNSNFEIELIDETELISNEENIFSRINTDKSILGVITFSRIVFTNNFNIGYLSYSFYCGNGCAWNNNIEIKKINGKWKITKHFSGGIA